MFDRLGEMFQESSVGAIVVIVLILVAIIGIGVFLAWRKAKKAQPNGIVNQNYTIPAQSATVQPITNETPVTPKQKGYGHGQYKAMVYLYPTGIDFTTIPEPVGNIYQFDTSCPFSGGGYIVRETKDGQIVDYDPREVAIITKELPEWAWFAIHCKQIVQRFWTVPAQWWKSVSMWFAAAMILVVFIAFLAVFGG